MSSHLVPAFRHRMAALVTAAALAGCGGSHRVTLTARGATPFADSPVTVRVGGLPAGGRAMLAASWTSFDGRAASTG